MIRFNSDAAPQRPQGPHEANNLCDLTTVSRTVVEKPEFVDDSKSQDNAVDPVPVALQKGMCFSRDHARRWFKREYLYWVSLAGTTR